jgi:serine/threonine protein kinase
MPIKIGSVYNATFKSGNTHTAFSWPSKIPASGNKYMKHKVIKIKKKLNPKNSLDYDYVGDIYDKNDGAVELKNIKIVSKQLILKSSSFKVEGKRKKSKKRTKKKSSRKTRRSSRKTRKRKMRGGSTGKNADEGECKRLYTELVQSQQAVAEWRQIEQEEMELEQDIAKMKDTTFKEEQMADIKQRGSVIKGKRVDAENLVEIKIKEFNGGKCSEMYAKRREMERGIATEPREQGSWGSVEYLQFQAYYKLGKGVSGEVYLVKKIGGTDDGNFYALKKINKKGGATYGRVREMAVNERNLLEEVTRKNVPFCVKMHYSFEEADNYCIVQPFYGRVDLFYFRENYKFIPINTVRFIAAQVTLALEALHNLDIVHRDIKTENIMIDSDGYLVVIDLGFADKCKGKTSGLTEFKGTPEYMAPEMVKGLKYGKAIDWWALGTIIYELMDGLPPFFDTNKEQMYIKIVSGKLVFPTGIGRHAKDLIGRLLNRSPTHRLTDSEAIKKHPFFETKDWTWDTLKTKRYDPPYKPTLYFKGDLRHSDSFPRGGEASPLGDVDPQFKYFAEEGSPNPYSSDIQGLIDQGSKGRQGGGSISSAKKIGAPYTRERSNAIYS